MPPEVEEQIGYYVYLLRDPKDHKVFYVGKGQGHRILEHAIFQDLDLHKPKDEKELKIAEILSRKDDNLIDYQILRHGLTEKEALEVEASVIDVLGVENLTNEVRGLGTERGISSLEEILINYTAEDAEINIPVILININQTFEVGMTPDEIYNITRRWWVLNPERASNYEYVFAVYRGIVREIFKVSEWKETEQDRRYQFIGSIVTDDVLRRKYLHKSVSNYLSQGNQNPIRYIN